MGGDSRHFGDIMGKFEQHNFLEKLLWLLFGQCVVKLGYFLVYRLVALPVPMNALCKWQHWHIFLLFFTRRKFRSNLQQKWSTKKFKYKVFKCTATTSTCTPTYLPTSDKFEWCRATCGGQDHYLPQFHKSIFSFKSFSLSVHFEPLSAALSKVSQFTSFFEMMIDYDEVFKEKTSFLCLRSNFALRAFRHWVSVQLSAKFLRPQSLSKMLRLAILVVWRVNS